MTNNITNIYTDAPLEDVETTFQNYLLSENDNDVLEQNLYALLHHIDGPMPEKRLQIYFDAYRLRIIEILSADYEHLHTLAGDELFSEIVLQYIKTYPSKETSGRNIGNKLPHFLKTTLPYSNYPYLVEMAQFEKNIAYTWDSKDSSLLSIADLRSVSMEAFSDLQFEFHPSFTKLELSWNILELCKAMQNEEEAIPPTALAHPILCIQWRKGIENFYRALNLEESTVLQAVENGASFGEMCELLCDFMKEEEVPLRAIQYLHQWLEEGLLAKPYANQ